VKTDYNEIDEGTGYIGFREAFDIIGANVRPVGDEALSLDLCVCRVAAADLVAMVSYHSVGVSLKDGFAVKSTDVVYADRRKPVCLKVTCAWGRVRTSPSWSEAPERLQMRAAG